MKHTIVSFFIYIYLFILDADLTGDAATHPQSCAHTFPGKVAAHVTKDVKMSDMTACEDMEHGMWHLPSIPACTSYRVV